MENIRFLDLKKMNSDEGIFLTHHSCIIDQGFKKKYCHILKKQKSIREDKIAQEKKIQTLEKLEAKKEEQKKKKEKEKKQKLKEIEIEKKKKKAEKANSLKKKSSNGKSTDTEEEFKGSFEISSD